MSRKSLQHVALVVLTAAIAVILSPRPAYAHIGVSPAHDLLHGLQHPFTGLDHLLAMFAVGLWAAQRGGRALWLVPLTFASVMAVGTILGMAGVSIPFVEPGIAVSVLTLGIFVASAMSLPLSISAAVVGLFALLHGYAHGAEIATSTSAVTYAFGFILATIFLHLTGISVGLVMQRMHFSRIVQYAGAAIAVCGVLFCIR
jgi:urease accessory protein